MSQIEQDFDTAGLRLLFDELSSRTAARLFIAIQKFPDEVPPDDIDGVARRLEECFREPSRRQRLLLPEFLRQRWTAPCHDQHPKRQRDWIASRRALVAVCEEAAHDNGVLALSLAHAAGLGVAIGVVSAAGEPCRVGIDFEPSVRRLEPGALRFVANPQDDTGGTAPLVQWCAREAAFKSISTEINLRLRDVWLRHVPPLKFATGCRTQRLGTVWALQNAHWTIGIGLALAETEDLVPPGAD